MADPFAQLEQTLHPMPGFVLVTQHADEGRRGKIILPGLESQQVETGVAIDVGEGFPADVEPGVTLYYSPYNAITVRDYKLLHLSAVFAWESP